MEPLTKPLSPPVLWRQPRFYLGLLLAVYLILGLRVVTHYGASWDEALRYDYAQRSLAAYSGQAGDLTDDKGPFYGMLALLGGRGFQALIPGWMEIDGWHFMTFLSYLLGVYFFYRLARRWIEPTPALAATLLFSTQPLLWGHAFINPKDSPFMAFFIASICLGLEMVDHFHPLALPQNTAPGTLLVEIRRQLARDWSAASARSKRLFMGLGIALVLLALGVFPLRLGAVWLVEQAYHASPSSALGALFGRFAGQAQQIPVQAYAAKAQALIDFGILALAVGIVLTGLGTARMIFRTLAARIECLFPARVLLAAAFLGFCSDIRSLGIASGALIAVYFWIKNGRKSLPFLLEYLGAGALTLYIFWPYLWNQPGKSFLETLTKSADFSWKGTLLFGGQVYANKGQPDSYLPTLFSIQLTEPALVLILAGLVIAALYFIRHSHRRLDILLLGAWFAAPVGAAILLHSTIYNNFRQFLFVLPPLFILAGLALQALWDLLKRRTVFFAPIALLLLLPALYWNFQLHPYQYVYYNSLSGGVGGASRVYEGDYWLTANKEGVEYLNQVAPEGASVVVYGKISFTESYARPDLTVLLYDYDQPSAGSPRSAFPGYAVLTSQYDMDRRAYPDSPILYQVDRDGAVLLVVKQVRQGDLILKP